MSHKYDIDSDQLKCNFCTQWFKTTLHYANLQRYSLKACNKCFRSFNYTILHPETYQIYKVLLFDINLNIPPPSLTSFDQMHQLLLELNLAKDQIKSRITNQYQTKIRKLMEQMEIITHKLEDSAREIEVNFLTKARLAQSQKVCKVKSEILKRIEQFKHKGLQFLEEKEPKLVKNASSNILASIKNSSRYNQKENQPLNKPSCKSIRDRINKPHLLQSKDKKVLSNSRESHQMDSSLPKTLNKSVIFKSVKCLDQSYVLNPNSSFQESERAEIQRLIQNYSLKATYLPCEVTKDMTNITKCQSKRTHADTILDLRSRTSKGGELIELIGAGQASKINFQCFLQSLGSQSSTKVVRIIKSGITDYDFDALLRFLSRHSGIETLIVTNNKLSEMSVEALKTFLRRHPNSCLKRIYMGNNRILRQKVSGVLKQVAQKGIEICL